jgi:hypothetical protein
VKCKVYGCIRQGSSERLADLIYRGSTGVFVIRLWY